MITIKKISPIIRILLFVAAIATAAYIYFFLINNFYPSIAGTQNILLIRKNTISQPLNIQQFNQLLQSSSNKTTQTPPDSSVNPFK